MARRHRCGWSLCLLPLLAIVGLAPMLAQGGHPRHRDHDWVAPAKDAAKVNPLANRPETALGGQKVFQQRCSTCHGDAGHGTTKAPDLTGRDVQAQSDGALFWKITGGNSHQGMPAFSFLPELQRWQLVLHLRAAAGSVQLGSSIPWGECAVASRFAERPSSRARIRCGASSLRYLGSMMN